MGQAAVHVQTRRSGTPKLQFRGPIRPLEGEYLAFLGGTETYGKFIAKPFPELLEERLGLPCFNFGLANTGVDAFLYEKSVVEAASGAKVTVIQLTGAQNLSNGYYSVHPRRNDRFVRASMRLKMIFRDVDFADFTFTRHMLASLAERSKERFELVEGELQTVWLARMKLLLSRITGKTVLLWLPNDGPQADRYLGADPLFVTPQLVAKLRPMVDELLMITPSEQARALGTKGMVFEQPQELAASQMLGPAVHTEVASELAPVLKKLL